MSKYGSFQSYSSEFPNVALERTDGILTIRLHSDGDALQWDHSMHPQLVEMFDAVASDPENRVVILTGTGKWYSGPPPDPSAGRWILSPTDQDPSRRAGRAILENLLRIEAPVIAAVNGPAIRHAEIPLLSDIIIASPDATFSDPAHFVNGLAPGDGHHVIMPAAIGVNRARYYLLTGQTIGAEEALRIGLINEVLPKENLIERARELAAMIARQPPLAIRATRLILTQRLRREMFEQLEYGLILEGMAAAE